MPVVYAVEQRKKDRRLLSLVFPNRTSVTAKETLRWDWPELYAGKSAIQGFGLYPRNTDALDWTKVSERRPVALPYLGMETEVESSVQARVLRSVLCGCFDEIERRDLHCPDGHEWVQDGLYVTLMPTDELDKHHPKASSASSSKAAAQNGHGTDGGATTGAESGFDSVLESDAEGLDAAAAAGGGSARPRRRARTRRRRDRSACSPATRARVRPARATACAHRPRRAPEASRCRAGS